MIEPLNFTQLICLILVLTSLFTSDTTYAGLAVLIIVISFIF